MKHDMLPLGEPAQYSDELYNQIQQDYAKAAAYADMLAEALFPCEDKEQAVLMLECKGD